MHPIIAKTFGGLTPRYYFRHFFFSVAIFAFIYFVAIKGRGAPIGAILFFTVNTFLYPYARFVYEGVVDFLIGRNAFYVNAIILLLTKLMTMFLCWVFALFIAPIGLIYLYYHHSKTNRQQNA